MYIYEKSELYIVADWTGFSLSERVVVDEHGCHTALHFGVKA